MEYKIGDKVNTSFGEGVIFGFNQYRDCCVVEFSDFIVSKFVGFHDGYSQSYQYDENGKKIEILPSDKPNRYWIDIDSITKIEPIYEIY